MAMNKNLKLGFCAMAAITLAACSDSDISSAEAFSENFPADFSLSEYAQVNPDLGNYQLIQAVSKVNTEYVDKVKQDSLAAWKAAMPAATLDSIKTAVAAASPELSPEALDSVVQEKVDKSFDGKLKKVTVSFSDEDQQAIFYDDSLAVKTLFVDYANISAAYWPGMNALKNGLTDEEGNLIIDGQRALEYRESLAKFHCFGKTASQDVAFLESQKSQIDSTLIEKHYLMSGRYEGRAYRFCHEGEAQYLQFITTVTVDTIPDTTWEYVEMDTVVLDSTPLNPIRYVLYNETLDSTMEKSIVGIDLEALEAEGFVVQDTIEYTVVEKTKTIKTDSTMTVGVKYATTIERTPVSANANAYNGNMGRVWDFSADYYCKNKEDGNIYIIQQ